jgi:LysR family nitrogen assimilation transcriptional regulator
MKKSLLPSSSPFMRPMLWRLFVDLVEIASVSKVADLRNVSQPQIIRQLAELETLCGERLFDRHGRGIHLTEWGHWVLPRVRAWLTHTEQIENDIRAGAGVPIGEVRVAVIPSAISPLLCPVLMQAHTLYPLVRIRVQEALDSQIEEGLINGKIDLAIRYAHSKNLRRGDESLQTIESFLVGPIGDPLLASRTVKFSRLKGLEMVLPRRPSGWRDTLDEIAKSCGFELNIRLEADSTLLQKEMVIQEGSYTILGPFAVATELKQRKLQASVIVEPAVPRMVSLSVQEGSVSNPAQEAIAELIRKNMRNLPENYFSPQLFADN